jgi:hypothetical protein
MVVSGQGDPVALLYAFGITAGIFYNTTTPLFFELAMETVTMGKISTPSSPC